MRRVLPGGATLGGSDEPVVVCRTQAAVMVRTRPRKVPDSGQQKDGLTEMTGQVHDQPAEKPHPTGSRRRST